jgi:hypothetical protein
VLDLIVARLFALTRFGCDKLLAAQLTHPALPPAFFDSCNNLGIRCFHKVFPPQMEIFVDATPIYAKRKK